MDKLNEEISSAVQLQSNNLSLGVSCGLQYFLPQAGLREFSQTHPDISLFIEESDSRKCEALVAKMCIRDSHMGGLLRCRGQVL